MTERKLILTDLKIEYDGLVDINEFFRFMEDWFKEHGYEKKEIRHAEVVKEKGKYVDLEIMPWKEVIDYAKYEINVRTRVYDLVQTTAKKEGKELKLNKGKIVMSIKAFLATDVRERWESRPGFFFLRVLFDKFINKIYVDRFEKELVGDVQDFHTEMKAYLNLQEYRPQA